MSVALIISFAKWLMVGVTTLAVTFFVRKFYRLKAANKERKEALRGHDIKDRVNEEIAKKEAALREREKEIADADKEGIANIVRERFGPDS